MSSYVGIDVGTTHIKTGVFDQTGKQLHMRKTNTPLRQEKEGSYYVPEELASIVKGQLAEVFDLPLEIAGIGITGMAEAGLVIDRESKMPLSTIIPWFDKRTLPLSEALTEEEAQACYYSTGLRNSFKYGIYKYLWCLEHEALEVKHTMWLSICDYIFYVLTGEICTEATFAARTFVFDIRKRGWDLERMERLGLAEENFPKIVITGAAAGTLPGRNIPVALCGHDHICSAYAFIKEEGQICNSCGTAETYVGLIEKLPDLEMERTGLVYGPSPDPQGYYGMANLSSSGQSVEWIRKHIQEQEIPFEKMNDMLQALTGSPGDILYFPYLSGMGSPLFSAECSAAFLGIKAEHTGADLLRAVIEGIGYQSKWIIEKGFAHKETAVISTGGPTASAWWMQCKADQLRKTVMVPQVLEGTLLGAVRLFLNQNEHKKESFELPMRCFEPDPKRAAAYETRYRKKFIPCAGMIAAFTMKDIDMPVQAGRWEQQ